MTSEPLTIRSSSGAQTIVAVKSARLIEYRSRIFFGPRFVRQASVPYSADTDALCESDTPHRAPDVACSCGFHAVPTRRDLWRLDPAMGTVILDVELSGTVIVHEFGWRAGHQSVLGVHLPPVCTRTRCRRPTAGVAPYRTFELQLPDWRHLRPVCERCAKGKLVPMSDLASALHAEVSTDDPLDAAASRARRRLRLFRAF
jgi:hypothetical protein